MARKIKFALEMADGTKVRSNLEELREHFDIKSIMGYFLSGKLQEWLEDRYYENEAEQLSQLNKDASDIHAQVCNILGVESSTGDNFNLASIERLNEKRALLRQVTDDEDIIEHAAQSAFNQEELADLIESDIDTIYLCGEKFTIPAKVPNKTYIGVNNPHISINVKSKNELDAKSITIKNAILPDCLVEKQDNDSLSSKTNIDLQALSVYERTKELYGKEEAEAEKLYMEHQYEKALEIFIESAKKTPRAYYFIADLYESGMCEALEISKSKKFSNLAAESDDILAKCYILSSIEKETGEYEIAVDKIFTDLKNLADKGDPFACGEIYQIFKNGYTKIDSETAEKYAYKSAELGNSYALIQLGIKAVNSEDYNKAKELFNKAKKCGNPRAFEWIGWMYENGKGEDKDFAKALSFYKSAAQKGIPELQNYMGNIFYNGNGTEQNYEKAHYWYEQAANKNFAEAQNNLGNMYANGNGVEQNYEKACYWYKKAADLGNAWGQYNLGYDYYWGYAYEDETGPLQDYKKAIKYFKLSAQQNNYYSMYYLGECYRYGHGVKLNMDMAYDWYLKSSKGYESAKEVIDDWENIMNEYNRTAWMSRMSDEERQEMRNEIDNSIKMMKDAMDDLERSPFERFMKKLF